MHEDEVARILKMLEEGKITAVEAEKLIAAIGITAQHARSSASGGHGVGSAGEQPAAGQQESGGRAHSFEFRWSKGRSTRDLTSVFEKVGRILEGLDLERFVQEAREGGRRWQERTRGFTRWWSDLAEGRPENSQNLPTAIRAETREFDLEGVARLEVTNPLGDVAVLGGADRLSVEIARQTWAPTEAEANARLEQVQIVCERLAGEVGTDETTGERLAVRVMPPAEWSEGVTDLVIRAPSRIAAAVGTTFGEIRVENLAGSVELESTSGAVVTEGIQSTCSIKTVRGEVRLHRAGGPVTVTTVSGDVSVQDASDSVAVTTSDGEILLQHVSGGPVEVRTVCGPIRIEHLPDTGSGAVLCYTVSGAIELTDVAPNLILTTVKGRIEGTRIRSHSVRATTVNGPVELRFEGSFQGEVNIATVSGDVCVAVPEAGDFRYHLTSSTGQVQCTHAAPDAMRSCNTQTGTVRHGQGSVRVHTLSGNIALTVASSEA